MTLGLIKLTDKQDTILQKVYANYTLTFPAEERRNEVQFFDLLNNSYATIRSIRIDAKEVGYIVIWELSNAIFIEHFEIYSEFRGQKIGEKVIQYLIKNHDLVILETEPEHYGKIAQRRINFYKRNGLIILDKEYIQPAYEPNKESISLFLMGSEKIDDLEKIKREIYSKVYNK